MSGNNRDESRDSAYKEQFIAFSNRMERWGVKLLIVLAVLVLFFQTMLHLPMIRPLLTTVDQLEGSDVDALVELDLRYE